MLDEIGGVVDHTRNQDLPGGEFHVAPDFELSQEKDSRTSRWKFQDDEVIFLLYVC